MPPARRSVFQAFDRKTKRLLNDHLELHVLELPKLRDALEGCDEPSLAAWCRFLSAETDEQLEALAMQHTILHDAKRALDELSEDRETRERAAEREAELKLYQYGAELLRSEGVAEGRQLTLLDLLKAKFGELPEGVQARIRSASSAELDLLTKRVLTADTFDALWR